MIELGKLNTLKIVEKVDFGVYLGTEKEKVLLPKKQVPEGAAIGDELTVFVYRDSSDRLISTVNSPLIMVGEVKPLAVKAVTNIGAFLDWGLEKDLLLPYKQQTTKVAAGRTYLVSLYVDKSNRLCATMRIERHLSAAGIYLPDAEVSGIVYEINPQYGAFVAVDNKYFAMVPKRELHPGIKVGDQVNARVTSVREDGKLNITLLKKAYLQMEDDAVTVMKVIEDYDGELPYDDKANPEIIKKDFNMSKSAFKRAVGKLLKEGKVKLVDGEIHII